MVSDSCFVIRGFDKFLLLADLIVSFFASALLHIPNFQYYGSKRKPSNTENAHVQILRGSSAEIAISPPKCS